MLDKYFTCLHMQQEKDSALAYFIPYSTMDNDLRSDSSVSASQTESQVH
jgi:hypothetical protein